MKILITLDVPDDFAISLSMQPYIEQEIKADRWMWEPQGKHDARVLYTKPQITSERELELLAEVKEEHTKAEASRQIGNYFGSSTGMAWCYESLPEQVKEKYLSQLAVIEQTRKFIVRVNAYLCLRDEIPTEVTDDLAQALALTSDLSKG